MNEEHKDRVKDNRSLFYFGILIAALIAACLLLWPKGHEQNPPALVKTPISSEPAAEIAPVFKFEIVSTPDAQEKGLGGRADVPQNYGMLFVFPSNDEVGFWMKDMLVPIDIIWLSDKGSIIGIEDSVSPDSYPSVFYPPQPVRYVLETKAGEARRQGWKVGTLLPLPLQS